MLKQLITTTIMYRAIRIGHVYAIYASPPAYTFILLLLHAFHVCVDGRQFYHRSHTMQHACMHIWTMSNQRSSARTTTAGVGPGEPGATGAGLALAVEVHGGDGRAEVVAPGEATGVEVVAPRRRGEQSLPPKLLE